MEFEPIVEEISGVNIVSNIKDWSIIKSYKSFMPKSVYVSSGINAIADSNLGIYKDHRDRICASGFVGVCWLVDFYGKKVVDSDGKKFAIRIEPRFKSINPWEMLIKVFNDPEYELYAAEAGPFFHIYSNEKMIPLHGSENGGLLLAALSFIKECERICKKHVSRSMSFEESNFNGKVVGNIQVSKHIKANITQGREDRIFCRYPIFTIDTLENRILKSALAKAKKILKSSGVKSSEYKKICAYCENALKAVRVHSVSKSEIAQANLTGFNSYYKNAIELAKVVLFTSGVDDLANKENDKVKYVVPYKINMERLFEFYVRASIKEYLRNMRIDEYSLDKYRTNKNDPLHVLKENKMNPYIMNNYIPDIAIIRDGKYVAVYDVKYQYSTGKASTDSRRHNSHQILFYTLLLNVPYCGFIFPNANNAMEYGIVEESGSGLGLQIQESVLGVSEEKEYTQWLVDMVPNNNYGFAERIMSYLKIKDCIKKED